MKIMIDEIEKIHKVLDNLEHLEEELRKDIREGEYFGDSYICEVVDKLYKIRQKFENM